MELLSLIPVIGFALAWQHWLKTSAAAALLHAVSIILLALFLGSVIGALLPATVLLMVVGTALTVAAARRHIQQHIALPVPIGIFAILCVAYWLFHSEASLFYYDEYSHWGVFLKEMLARNQLWGADTNSMHTRYLPGTSLWQYFFAVFSDNMEGAAYLAQFALLLTPLLVLWEKIRWNQPIWLLGIITFVIIATSDFGHGFTSLYVDHLLGAWFAGVLLNILFDLEDRRSLSTWSMLLPLATIVLIKSTGVFFALAAAGVITLLLLVQAKQDARARDAHGRFWRPVIFPAAVAIMCLAILTVWNMNRDSNGLGSDVTSTDTVVSRLIERKTVFSEQQQTEFSRRFLDVILHQQISKDEISARYNEFTYPLMPLYTDKFRLTTVSLLGLAAIAFLLLLRFVIQPGKRVSWTIAGGGAWLAAIAYILVIFLGYRYVLTADTALLLSSYVRYAQSMLLPVVLVCLAPLTPAFSAEPVPRIRIGKNLALGRNAAIFAGVIAALLIFERPYLKPLYTAQTPPPIRSNVEPLTDQLRGKIGDAPIWVFFPNDVRNGFIGHVLQFLLSPGRAHVEENANTLLDDPVALKDELRNFEYIWFALQDPATDAAAEKLIGRPLSARLYRIIMTDNGVSFQPVPDAF